MELSNVNLDTLLTQIKDYTQWTENENRLDETVQLLKGPSGTWEHTKLKELMWHAANYGHVELTQLLIDTHKVSDMSRLHTVRAPLLAAHTYKPPPQKNKLTFSFYTIFELKFQQKWGLE